MAKLKKDDNVVVIAGKDKGKKGKILRVYPSQNKAIVENVNFHTKHLKPSNENPQGGKSQIEGKIDLSNLMLIDPKTQKKTRVGYSVLKDGSKQRISKVSQEVLD